METSSALKAQPIFVTGHRGLLGSAVTAELRESGYARVVTATRAELDLTDQRATREFFEKHRPRAVVHCAALVGGIQANTSRPADFVHQNMLIQDNVIHSAHLHDVDTLVNLGSNCMYPLGAPQPMPETELLKGPVEPTNQAYGAAKLVGFVQAQSYHRQYGRNYFTVIPAGVYGPHDNFDLDWCHVTPALIRRFHEAKLRGDRSFSIWGTGTPRRELLYAGDAARGIRLALEKWRAKDGAVNIGTGHDLSVREIAETIRDVVGFEGGLTFDLTKPDGNPRKLLDSTLIERLGFKATTPLKDGLARTYAWLTSGAAVRGLAK